MAGKSPESVEQASGDELIGILRRVRRRLLLRRWLRCTATGLLVSASAACLWVILTRLFPMLGAPAMPAIVMLGAGYLAGCVAAWVSRPGLVDAALASDRALGLKERLTSSLELADRRGPMVAAVHADARRIVRGLNIAKRFPLAADRRHRWVYAPLLALGAAYMLFPEIDLLKHEARQAEARARQEAVAVKAERIQEELRPLKEKALDAEAGALADLSADIEALAADLERGRLTERQALAKLSNLAERLEERRGALAEQAAAPKLGSDLSRSGMTRELARALQEGQLGAAAKKSREIADKLREGDLSERERKALQRELNALARALSGESSELSEALAKALSEAAASLESGDIEGTLSAMKNVELSLADLDSVLDQLEQMDTMKAYLAEWQGDLMGPSAYCRACGMKMSDCEGGQCCTAGNANCGGCSNGMCNGAGAGLRGAGRGQGNRLGDVPEADAGLQPTLAKGPLTKGKMLADILQRTAPEAGEEANVDYISGAFVEAKQEAEEALTQEEIPAGAKEYVRQYFGSLEPEE